MKMKKTFLIILVSVFGIHTEYSQQSPIRFYRFTEDYQYLSEKEDKTFWESLKYIPLGEESFLSIGGEVRSFFIVDDNERWNTEINNDGYLRQRFMLHSDLNLNKNFRVFTQLYSIDTYGRELGPIPQDEDIFDVQQLFAEYRGNINGGKWFARLGRQEFNIGNHQILQIREGLNARLVFDALRLNYQKNQWQVDAFYSNPVQVSEDTLDNEVFNNDLNFWGVNLALFSADRTGRIDAFYFGYDRETARFAQGVGEELRHSIGARYTLNKNGWSLDYEATYQFGDFIDGSINAWGAALFTGYQFENTWGKPKLTGEISYTSGDKSLDDQDLQSFNPLFPRGNYFGETAIITGINTINPAIMVDVYPIKNHQFHAELDLLYRSQTDDGLYFPPNIFFYPAGGSTERYIGSQLTLSHTVVINQFLTGVVAYANMFSGDFIKETRTDENVRLFSARLQFKF